MDSIGNYTILETLSERGATRVYLAVHNKLGRKTLLKVYSGNDAKLVRRFETEARIAADLNDESIVSVYDFGESDGRFYISMEYVEGHNLSEYLRLQPLTDEQIIDLAGRIARSVSVFHRKDYIHRDLKPENILIDAKGRIKITDFGLAWHQSLARVTLDGEVLGTPLYMSPEQINNLPLTPSCDVFALGIIYYQMATGYHPFAAEHYGEIFSKILTSHPSRLNTIRPSIPPWFAELVEKLLQKEPKNRLPNALDIVAVIETHTQPQRSTKRKKTFAPPLLRRRSAKGIGMLFAVVLLLLLIYVFKQKEEKSVSAHSATSPKQNTPAAEEITGEHAPQAREQPINIAKSHLASENFKSHSEEQKPARSDLIMNSAKTPDQNQRQETLLLIKTWPWCRIYLNDRFVETTPMTSPVRVTPGRYLLSLQNPLYPLWSDSILIRSHSDNEFTFHLDSLFYRFELKVVPWGEVFIDDHYIGTTPLSQPVYLTRRHHVITIKNRFYKNWVDTLLWAGQDRVEKNIVLNELQ